MAHVAVFDTNVLLSAVGWRGKPYECLELARQGAIEGLTCQEVIDELADKLKTKLGLGDDEMLATVADLLSFLALVPISGNLKAIAADPDDDKVLECAVSGSATHIVTGDRRHLLPIGSYQGVAIVTPAEFLKIQMSP
jgi:putative PIN family toxin of toxin-antitoxin system